MVSFRKYKQETLKENLKSRINQILGIHQSSDILEKIINFSFQLEKEKKIQELYQLEIEKHSCEEDKKTHFIYELLPSLLKTSDPFDFAKRLHKIESILWTYESKPLIERTFIYPITKEIKIGYRKSHLFKDGREFITYNSDPEFDISSLQVILYGEYDSHYPLMFQYKVNLISWSLYFYIPQ